MTTGRRSRIELSGIGVSPGVAIGQVFVIDRRRQKHPKHHIGDSEADSEIQRYTEAVEVSVRALHALAYESEHSSTEEPTQILNAHILMLQDPLLYETIKKEIKDHRKCAEWAVVSAVKVIRTKFEKLGNAYFRERRSDVDFIGDQILVRGEVIEKSESTHIITIKTTILNQDSKCLIDGIAKVIVQN